MSYTTDYLLEVMDYNQIEDMNELQEYFSVVQNGNISMSTIATVKKQDEQEF